MNISNFIMYSFYISEIHKKKGGFINVTPVSCPCNMLVIGSCFMDFYYCNQSIIVL